MKYLTVLLISLVCVGCNDAIVKKDYSDKTMDFKFKLLDKQLLYFDSASYFLLKMVETKSRDSVRYYSDESQRCIYKSETYSDAYKSLTHKQP